MPKPLGLCSHRMIEWNYKWKNSTTKPGFGQWSWMPTQMLTLLNTSESRGLNTADRINHLRIQN